MAREKTKHKKPRHKKKKAKKKPEEIKPIHWNARPRWFIAMLLAAVCISIAVSVYVQLFYPEYLYVQWFVILFMSAIASRIIVRRTCNACSLGVGAVVGLVSSTSILVIRILAFNFVPTLQEIFFYLFAGLIFGIFGCIFGSFRL